VALAASAPLLIALDSDVSEDALTKRVFSTDTQTGDALQLGLGALPLLLGGIDAFGGDPEFLEVTLESMAATLAATYALKLVVDKERPDGSSEDSFPSGHASFAFAGATLLARSIHDRWGTYAGYLAYLPAAYVGISRIEGQRHYLADVTAGAALGLFITHMIYNAHYGESGEGGIFGMDSRIRLSIGPAGENSGTAIGLEWSF
jgi:hypothetical protein